MESGDDKLRLVKKDQRPDSEFFAREFLYDLVNSTLDPARREAVDKAVKENRELQEDVEKIRAGIHYASQLAATKVADSLLEQIDEPETYMSVLLKKTNYERWPMAVKWGLEALVVLAVLVSVLVIVPWDKALKWGLSPRGREIVLAEMSRPPKSEIEIAGTAEHAGETVFEDEGTQAANQPKPVPPPPVAVAPVPAVPAAAPVPAKTPPVAAAVPAPAAPTVAAVDADKRPKGGEGALYRGVMSVTNVGVTSAKIRDKVIELGGRKAGEVEIGWRKTPTQSYFHFTMPEAKYEELQRFLADYGKSDLHKEKHPRVMPDGIIRLILTVEEAKK